MRIKITENNIYDKMLEWSNGQNLTDELVFINGSIDASEWILKVWNTYNIIIKVEADNLNFSKFIYLEKL